MNKTCAICFSGQVRTGNTQNVISNILENLIKPLISANYNLHYFAAVEKDYKSFPWSGFMVVHDSNFWPGCVEKYNNRLGPGVKGGSFNVLNQWKKCQVAGQLKKIYEETHKFNFDMVVRIRPDVILREPIDLNTINLDAYNIPNHDNWFGYNDRMCIGSSKNMDFCMIEFVDSIDKYFTQENILFHSETLFKHHLDKKNIPIHRPNFTIQLQRENGPDPITFN
jgi:hypothetical protein